VGCSVVISWKEIGEEVNGEVEMTREMTTTSRRTKR
jgi:hypothetical protein